MELHHQIRGNQRLSWNVARLLELARDLPQVQVPLAEIDEFDSVYWFDAEHPPTCRAVVEHGRRIELANLEHPVILSEAGLVMDGMHRVAKAHILGLPRVMAVRFERDPEPDLIEEL
jgi:hypothetical protein